MTDGLGSTVGLCDGSGNAIATYTYDAFGIIRSSTGSSTNDWLYTGQQRDDESGFDYLRARYYDSQIGRFLGQDAAAPDWKSPGTLNRFSYALNSPMVLVDPTGLSATGTCFATSSGTSGCYGTVYNPDGTQYNYIDVTFTAEGFGRDIPGLNETNVDILIQISLHVTYDATSILSVVIEQVITSNLGLGPLTETIYNATCSKHALVPQVACAIGGFITGENHNLSWFTGSVSAGTSNGYGWFIGTFTTDNAGGYVVTIAAFMSVVNGSFECHYGTSGIPRSSTPIGGYTWIGVSSNVCEGG